MVSARRGFASLGCLFTLLVIVTIAYFSVGIGEAYWRYYQYRDAMRQEARFASNRTDDEIQQRLRAFADSIGLPNAAGRVRVRRTPETITISASYDEYVELPLKPRDFHFSPRVEWTR